MSDLLGKSVVASGQQLHSLESGAGHDAGVIAAVAPWAMLFVRSPGGVSHSPDERVLEDDVHVALEIVVRFLDMLARTDVAENGFRSSIDPPGSVVNGPVRNDA